MKGDWKKIRDLSRGEVAILAQAAALFPAVKLAQRWFRLDKIHARLKRLFVKDSIKPEECSPRFSSEVINRLVGVAARRGLVRPSCLQHALVLWTLLHRHGQDAVIRFGVRKKGDALEAHAWVELGGGVLNDSENIGEQYTPFERPVVSAPGKTT